MAAGGKGACGAGRMGSAARGLQENWGETGEQGSPRPGGSLEATPGRVEERTGGERTPKGSSGLSQGRLGWVPTGGVGRMRIWGCSQIWGESLRKGLEGGEGEKVQQEG